VNLENFEKTWEREIKKSDYIVIYLRNGAVINAEKYEILSSRDIMLWWEEHWIALVRISTIKNIEGRTWIYGKINGEIHTAYGGD